MPEISDKDAEILGKIKRYQELQQTWGMLFYEPYKKQKDFHNMVRRERMFIAGNQLGKTLSAAMEVAFHMTGEYPEWWKGKRFAQPTLWWIGSETAELCRDGAQRRLLGPFGQFGAGAIPKPLLLDFKLARGTPEAIEVFRVRHKSGGISEGVFKAYADGRGKWQAGTVHGIWMDEEPPADIYSEGLTRTNATNGVTLVTLTPLKGMSSVVMRFIKKEMESPDRAYINMTIDDVGHYTPEERKKIIDGYPAHEREARAKGIPMLGSGRIFPIPQEWVEIDDFVIPDHYHNLIALDFGWDHPTAAVKISWDKESDCVYVTKCYRQSRETPLVHANAIKPWGLYPVAWPHDALQHDKGSGEQLASIYRKQGLKMISERAQFPDDRGYGVEAGITEMLQRMQTSQLKIFKSCVQWFEEFNAYHRKDGKVVKEMEDLMSATRYGLMMLRFAQQKVAPPPPPDRYRRNRYKNNSGRTWMSS